MLNLEEILNPNSFLLIQHPTSKKMVFDKICNKAFEKYNIDKNLLLNNLIKREKIGTTTIGNGIAIPHVQNDKVTKPSCLVAILSDGLDFDALDNNPVDIIVFLILPEVSKSENLLILAQVSRLLRDPEITDKLRGCKSEESAFAIISQHFKNKAA
ncbi:PTS sugar transporter subunit IIA [bacterium]|nr:PTS sugar transporter subunit IIA [bacterium]